ncbi:MAG: ATP-binding cassette domain-containing protein [bacterium]|nr:ATP-binding cassette domain-containing protein [bacterium]MDY4979694.1 ATP-binding cassette domain-containing protein [Candidatus Onthovivens sp.]
MDKDLRKEELNKIKEQKKDEKIKAKALEEQRIRVHNAMNAYEKKHKRERKIAPKGSFISLQHINKIYDNHVQAVYDFNLEIKKHEFIVFVGPSGCGKSTTLRMIAGLENITAGDLYIDGVYANDLEPKNRDIAMVFQSYALYPHMSVSGNMSFGLRIRKVPTLQYDKEGKPLQAINKGLIKDLEREYKNLLLFKEDCKTSESEKIPEIDKDLEEIKAKIEYLKVTPVDVYKNKHLPKEVIRERVLNAADILQIREYLDRKPKALSGGQCQRVALGRAIVRNAKVFLMDEPLSNLDAKLRVQMRSEIIRLHNQLKATTIYVTHDQTEAMTMATRIVVMSKGYIQQIGAPIEIYNHPANLFVATFIGSPAMNLLKGKISDGIIKFDNNYEINLGKEAKEKTLSFYKTELESYKKEKEELLANFVERNLLIEKINHLKTLENNDKNKLDIEKIEHELEHVTKSNERLSFLKDAIIKYEEFIKNNKFDVVFGIRPEDIYEENKAFTDGKLSEVIDGKVNVAELLGHEYFVHVDFDDEDLVAKIAAKRIINQEENIKLVLDLSKAHIFDAVSTKIIL